jgi:hypothetical protein
MSPDRPLPPPQALPRVLVRVVTIPHDERGEVLVVYVETRTVSDPAVVVYSLTNDEWRVEHHRHLMWRSRRASIQERTQVADLLRVMNQEVRILQAAPRALGWDDPDEAPVSTRRRRRGGT